MYKCTDCDKLYDIKPEYCECGNNLFEEVASEGRSVVSVHNTSFYGDTVKPKKSFYEQYPEIKRFVESLDVISVSFFVICIILSVLAIVFINPISDTTNNEQPKVTKQTIQNIPGIEKLWKDERPVSSAVRTTENTAPKTPVSDLPVTNAQTARTPVKKEKASAAKTTNKTSSVSKSKINNRTIVNTTSKAVSNSKSKTESSSTASANSKIIPSTKSNTPSAIVKTSSSAKKVQTSQVASKSQSSSNDEEWYNYRVALRQALFHNLSITSVTGSGKCQIEFSIDKNGKFINRAFSYQSSNESVNQAVYKMMMKLPSYYPPPDSYKGQKVKMIFSFDNGSYYINYVN